MNRTIPDRFARNLKALRTRQGVSQDVMATSIGVKRSSYSGYEVGSAEPSLTVLHAIQERYRIGADLMLNSDLYLLSGWQWHQLMVNVAPRTVEPMQQPTPA